MWKQNLTTMKHNCNITFEQIKSGYYLERDNLNCSENEKH